MALSGSVETGAWTSESGRTWKVVLSWTATQNKENNTSEISWNLKVSTASSGYVVVSELRVTIDGSEEYYRSSSSHTNGYNGTALASGTKVITHNSDGSRSITMKVEAGIYDWAINKSGTATFTLNPIPRASEIGATDANIDSNSSIVITKKASSYTHSIKYEFGSLSGYVTSSGEVSTSEVKFSASSVSFKVPTSFYAQIPNAKTGKCKLTCTTYSGSTKIGDAQTAEFTATAAESSCKPTVSGTVVDSNEVTKTLTGDESKLVKYFSDALCTIKANAKNSATIKTKKIGGTTVSGTTLTISGVETGSIAFDATDSRGYSNSVTVKATLVNYVKLTVNAQLQRVDPTSGNAKLTIRGNYFNASFGAVSNSLDIQYRIAKSGESYGGWRIVTPTKSGNSYNATVELSGLDYLYSYTAQVTCTDELLSKTVTVKVSQGIPVFDWGENDFSFHVPVTMGKGSTPVLLTSADDLNTIKASGWYVWTTSDAPKNVPSGANTTYISCMRVWQNGNTCLQECVDSSNSGNKGCKVQRVIYGSTAYDWEWVNPPMDAGVEYRTTERYNGKIVYAKLVNFGTLPSNTYKDVTLSSTAVMAVRIDGILNYTGESTYASLLGVSFVSSAQVLSTKIRITTNTTTATKWTAMVMVWYTKD